ncbi:hypothetical protein ACRN98_17870 [Shewanella oncorhynchi]|uniref:hypothetical protein n=1 Tax=Shewanella TaxID=22 RepID=UPI0021DA5EDF|nr:MULTISPECIES: hypothetical protein [unclassified Shewanella]MCU8040416.1 hypothetical protein [Shewanella sp. SM69]MCU8045665.1 hypothetical protein [Shewanella sp. SM68]MCU8049992.1 hypothetical protein [Shewanella sp. SM65]MCU8090181.1 hypothetical protein [Shewanella sp. SM20]
MDTVVVAVISALSLLLLVFVYQTFKSRRELAQLKVDTQVIQQVLTPSQTTGQVERIDFTIESDGAGPLVECTEIRRFPRKSTELDQSSELAQRSTHLISDVIKAAVNVPGKTVEVVFNPKIAEGLKDGTYQILTTKSGETLADAIDPVTKKIVGKGRIIEGGKLRQLSVGAFNLLSIAVAQSHLATIEKNLDDIKGQLKDIKDKLNSNDVAELQGAIDYYGEVKRCITALNSPAELSVSIANRLESINEKSHTWRNKVFEDLKTLNKNISSMQSLDTAGTENTFNKLKEYIAEAEKIADRYALLLRLSAISKAMLLYIDPAGEKFTALQVEMGTWNDLVGELKATLIDKADKQLSKALFNERATLDTRTEYIGYQTEVCLHAITENQRWFTESCARLEDTRNAMLHSGEIKVGLTFDEQGKVIRTALLS